MVRFLSEIISFRSTPCPNVKQSDEWGDPVNCENQDNCPYCHTRTEQQFHPEVIFTNCLPLLVILKRKVYKRLFLFLTDL